MKGEDMNCPRCGKKMDELHCNSCGYDADVFPEERGSQKEKGRYSPYKAGGKGRTKG